MARGRHVRRSGLLSRLWPRRRSRVGVLEQEVTRLRALTDVTAAAASVALVRASTASDSAVNAELRAVRAEAALAAARTEIAGLRQDLAALREELVWAFAEGRVPAPKVVDLRSGGSRSA